MSEYFAKKLGAPSDRGYIAFIDPGRANIGYVDHTFGCHTFIKISGSLATKEPRLLRFLESSEGVSLPEIR